MNCFFRVCCGEWEEELKYGAYLGVHNNNNDTDSLAREFAWDKEASSKETESSHQQQHYVSDKDRRQLYERQISRMNKLKYNLSAAEYNNTASTKRESKDFDNNNTSNGRSLVDGSFRHCRDTIIGYGIDTDIFTSYNENNEAEYVYPTYEKTTIQFDFIKMALQSNFIFTDMNDTEIHHFIMAMQMEMITSKGTKVIQQGDLGDYFYVVESGTIDFVQDDNISSTTSSGTVVGSCTTGGSFGELSLLYRSRRAVSCISSTDTVVLWKIDHTTFRHIMAHQDYISQANIQDLIRSIPIFQSFDDKTLLRFTKSLTPVPWKAGQIILQKGEEGSVFYIIQSGSVKVHDIGLGDSVLDDIILGPGQYFGERALMSGEPRAANVTAMNDVVTMAIDRFTFEVCIGPIQNVLDREIRKQSLQVIPIFTRSDITKHEIELLADQMQEVCYRKGEHLACTGQVYKKCLWIIRHGRLVVYSKKYDTLYNLKAGDCFGDKSVSIDDPDHVSSHTATCEENLTTWVLSREQIESVIGDIHRLGQSVQFSKTKQNQNINLKDLKRVHILGRGAFGTVWLVSHATDGNAVDTMSSKTTVSAYALKAISKAKILDAKLEKAVIREKDLLSLLNHPFILNLVASYQDADNLYLLLPLVLGGELYSLLDIKRGKGRGMENDDVAFYAACIFEALKHFHSGHNIAYRDLKLENILIDEEGYGKIIDLGFAKVVIGKTYTLCGTPEMLAPEIIMSKGHDHAVDYWAYGVIVYELLVGHTPFYEHGSSQIDMFKRIVLVKYSVPEFVCEAAKLMIEKLLVRQQSLRLGNLANGYVDIKDQAWFVESGVDFKKILKRKVKAPWIPEIHNPLDTSNFDDLSSLEHKRPSVHRPLSHQEQELFKDF